MSVRQEAGLITLVCIVLYIIFFVFVAIYKLLCWLFRDSETHEETYVYGKNRKEPNTFKITKRGITMEEKNEQHIQEKHVENLW